MGLHLLLWQKFICLPWLLSFRIYFLTWALLRMLCVSCWTLSDQNWSLFSGISICSLFIGGESYELVIYCFYSSQPPALKNNSKRQNVKCLWCWIWGRIVVTHRFSAACVLLFGMCTAFMMCAATSAAVGFVLYQAQITLQPIQAMMCGIAQTALLILFSFSKVIMPTL